MRSLMDRMNYRFENPTVTLGVDEEIVKKFLEQHRERHVREQFALWASMSKENADNKLVNMINSQEIKLENNKQNSK